MTSDPRTKPTSALLSDLLRHLSGLLRGEIALARAEIEGNVRSAVLGVGLIVAAMVIAISALNLLTAALVGALVELGLAPGWAALGVGIVLALVALGLVRKGVRALKLSSLRPDRTVRNVRRDAQTLKEVVKNDKSE